jgi:hypothetical protein
MKAIITWYNKADQLVVEAGAIQKDIAARVLALPTWEAQMDFVAEKVAPAVAQRYKAEVVRTRTGGVSFNKSDGSRDSTALSALRYWCAGTTLFAPSGSAAKKSKQTKQDPVANLLKAFEKLSKAEQKRFLASV